MSIDHERFRMLEDERQAAWLAEHGDPSRFEWPLLLVGATGVALVLVWLAYRLAAWLVA